MFAEFAKIFHQKMSREGFEYAPTTWASEDVTAETAEMAFQKMLGQDMCVVRLINADRIGAASFLNMQESAAGALGGKIERLAVTRIFIVNIFAGVEIGPEYEDIIANGDEFAYQTIYPLYWGVALAGAAGARACPNQPTDVGGVRRVLDDALATFRNNERVAAGSIDELERMVARTDPFPLKARVPVLTFAILAVNTVMMVVVYLNGGPGNLNTLIRFGALERILVLNQGQYYRLITVMFLHGSMTHFLSNNLGLVIFGARMERYLGRAAFLVLYLVSGLGGSLASVAFTRGVGVGASGAIYGLVGAAMAFTWVSGKYIDGISMYFLVLYSAVGISLGFLNPQVANAAHIGGFVTGFALSWLLCRRIKARSEARA